MSKLGITTVLLTGFLLATLGPARSQTAGNPAPSQTVDNFGKLFVGGPALYGSVGGVILRRSNPDSGIIVAANPATTTSFVNGSDYKFGWNVGVDATVGLRFWRSEAIEVRFLNFETSAALSLSTPGSFIGVGFTGPGGTAFASTYETKFSSWEVNWRHQVFGQFSVLAGVRSINVKDNLSATLNTTVAAGNYFYTNKLLGAQIGAELAVLPLSSPFQINVYGKIGRYNLDSDGGIAEFSGGTRIGGFGTSISDTVYASEAGISAGYRLGNNVLIRAGYQAFWLNNLGLASNNASGSLLNPGLLNTNVYRGDLFFQGINFGMQISF